MTSQPDRYGSSDAAVYYLFEKEKRAGREGRV